MEDDIDNEEEEFEITEEELAAAFKEIVDELRDQYGDDWTKHIAL